MMLFIRSSLFYLGFFLTLCIFSLLSLFLLICTERCRYHLMTGWGHFVIWWLAKTCHLTYQVHGLENLPINQAAVVLSNHQSAWETIAFQAFLPFQTWVLKRELLWLPLFGWGLATLNPIAIKRGNIRQSMRQIVEEGRKRLDNGQWLIIFPEGTRLATDERKRFGIGGAMLATQTGYPVVPIAHNSGRFWPKDSFIKYPGVIQVIIGTLLETKGKQPREINAVVEAWIVDTLQEMNDYQKQYHEDTETYT